MDNIKLIRNNRISPELTWHDGKVPYLSASSFDSFSELVHGFSTRLGGVSTGTFASMNMSFTKGEPFDIVAENYRRIGEAIGFDPENIVATRQTHSTNIRFVTEADRGKGFSKERDYDNVDGLITNIPGLVLAIYSADCVPLLFYDPLHHAIGAAHSGWRGTAGNIAGALIKKMNENFGTRPCDLFVAIGPHICPDCYEVGEEVAAVFTERYGLDDDVLQSILYKNDCGKYRLNLQNACVTNLEAAGVPRRQISLTDVCTCCNVDILFSHRKEKGKQGNLAAFLGLHCKIAG